MNALQSSIPVSPAAGRADASKTNIFPKRMPWLIVFIETHLKKPISLPWTIYWRDQMNKYLTAVCLALALALCAVLPAAAGDGGWRFQLAPYVWLAGLKGNVATLPGLPPADIEVDFYEDVLGNLNGALMLLGEARKGRFGVMADMAYTDIETENQTRGRFFSSVDSRSKNLMISALLFYRMIENKNSFLDVMAGGRYWAVDSSLTLKGGILRQRQISNKEDWVDPLLGLKGMLYLGRSKFYLGGFAFIGGFGVGSDLTYDLNANLGYQWTETFSTTIGYRYLSVDYEESGFKYDVDQQGPIVGFSWRF
jgi:hypothetical protein